MLPRPWHCSGELALCLHEGLAPPHPEGEPAGSRETPRGVPGRNLDAYSERLETAMLVVKRRENARRMRFSRRPRWDMVK